MLALLQALSAYITSMLLKSFASVFLMGKLRLRGVKWLKRILPR